MPTSETRSGAFSTAFAGVIRAAALASFAAGAQAAHATESVALTLSRGPGDLDTLDLTLEDLAALPQVTIVTVNDFSDGPVVYSGPLVRDVIERLSLDQAETLSFWAADDYHVDIPTDDFRRFDVILAMQADGVQLTRREKGPLWLMYPISDHPVLRDPLYIHRLIWQVVRIEAR